MRILLGLMLVLAFYTPVLGQEKEEKSNLALDINEELENISYSGGKLSGFKMTGTGILTAKPDNVFVQVTVKSAPSVNLKAAEMDVMQKVEFLIRGISREFKLKKENFAVSNSGTQLQERTKKGASANDQFDDDGVRIAKKTYSNTAKKTVVINNLGGKKQTEVMDILDAAAKYGASTVVSVDVEDTASESVSTISESSTQAKAVKGATAINMTANIQNPANQLINYHMNEETLKKLLKDAKAAAMLEVKAKYAKATSKIKINDKEFLTIKRINDNSSNLSMMTLDIHNYQFQH